LGKIKVGIVGVGNCASSFIQGLYHYSQIGKSQRPTNGRNGKFATKPIVHPDKNPIGIMNNDMGGYYPTDIEVVCGFDIDQRKVGERFDVAIKAKPNCTMQLNGRLPKSRVIVEMGPVLDGVSEHMSNFSEDRTFVLSSKKTSNVEKILRETETEILLNYLPVGSEKATRFYAEACLKTGVSFINCMPAFIVSKPEWAKRFEEKRIPIVGDDIKAQIGATIVHRTLAKLFSDRGVKIDRTYQLNTGGNTDFLNMLNRNRLASKKISKTEAVQSQLPEPLDAKDIHIGPSDYVPWQNDNKVCYIRIEGRGFGGFPVSLEARLSVEDSPNSAGCVIDAIRCCKIARDRKVGGALTSISAYVMKHPPKQISDSEAKHLVEKFVQGISVR
jgi:myo-inositol-1-phosphate synthase